MYERSTEEQKRDLDKAMLLIQEKNEKIKEVLTEFQAFKEQVEEGGYKASKKKDTQADGQGKNSKAK